VTSTVSIHLIDLAQIPLQQELDRGFAANSIQFINDITQNIPDSRSVSERDGYLYDYMAIGGSFDHLHNGHKSLLTVAAHLCRRELTVGITGSGMLTKKSHASLVDDFEARATRCLSFLSMLRGESLAVDVHVLNDLYGPTITKDRLQSIVVSSETLIGAFRINEQRVKLGMNALDILVIHRRDAVLLSSSFIRAQLALTLPSPTPLPTPLSLSLQSVAVSQSESLSAVQSQSQSLSESQSEIK
jgi:phosphopantetheine adenylyltransferase